MSYAAITGWGKCMPPSVLTNADLATFLDTSDEWIVSRTGMRERRISHVPAIDMAAVAGARASQELTHQGAINIFIRPQASYVVTALGEAPASTVMQFANSVVRIKCSP